jgi:hypothetical protein
MTADGCLGSRDVGAHPLSRRDGRESQENRHEEKEPKRVSQKCSWNSYCTYDVSAGASFTLSAAAG